MSILINGMEMPTEQTDVLIIAIQSDGSVFPVHIDEEGNPMIFQNEEMQNRAIPVPDHGDLIDRDALERDIDKYIGGEESRARFHHWVQVQSVVIPGDKEEET